MRVSIVSYPRLILSSYGALYSRIFYAVTTQSFQENFIIFLSFIIIKGFCREYYSLHTVKQSDFNLM